MQVRFLITAAALLSASFVAHADSLIGSTVDVTYNFPTLGTYTSNTGPVVVTPGLEIVSPGDANLTFTSGNLITITNPELGPFTATTFNGFDVSILSGPTIEDVTLDPLSDPAFASGVVISFTGNDIQLNFEGTCATCSYDASQNIELDVTTSSSVTPEPSSIALLGTGLLGVAGVLRKRFA